MLQISFMVYLHHYHIDQLMSISRPAILAQSLTPSAPFVVEPAGSFEHSEFGRPPCLSHFKLRRYPKISQRVKLLSKLL